MRRDTDLFNFDTSHLRLPWAWESNNTYTSLGNAPVESVEKWSMQYESTAKF